MNLPELSNPGWPPLLSPARGRTPASPADPLETVRAALRGQLIEQGRTGPQADAIVKSAGREIDFRLHSDSNREEAWKGFAPFAGQPAGEVYLDLLRRNVAPEWAGRLTRAIARPAGSTSLEERRAVAGRLGLDSRRELCSYHANKERAMEIWAGRVEQGIEPQAACREVEGFLDGIGPRGPGALEQALKDYQSLELHPGPKRELYLEMQALGFSGEWPARWLNRLTKPCGSSNLDQRRQLLVELRSMEAAELHVAKEQVFDVLAARQADGLSWEQAGSEVLGFLRGMQDLRLKVREDGPLSRYRELGLEEPARRELYLATAGAGFSGEWLLKALQEVSQPVPGTTPGERVQALAGLRQAPLQRYVNTLEAFRAVRERCQEGVEFARALREVHLQLQLGPYTDDPERVSAQLDDYRAGRPVCEGVAVRELPADALQPLLATVESLPPSVRGETLQGFLRLTSAGVTPRRAAELLASMVEQSRSLSEQLDELLRLTGGAQPSQGIRAGESFVDVGGVRLPVRRRSQP